MKFKDDVQIDLVSRSPALFMNKLGPEIGKMMEEEHKKNGVNVHNNAGVAEIHGNADGSVSSVTLTDGTTL
jgi:NADPH-dependent 2,4-dienoyl-CoA reductase/sulfur reductase-like enzyme